MFEEYGVVVVTNGSIESVEVVGGTVVVVVGGSVVVGTIVGIIVVVITGRVVLGLLPKVFVAKYNTLRIIDNVTIKTIPPISNIFIFTFSNKKNKYK